MSEEIIEEECEIQKPLLPGSEEYCDDVAGGGDSSTTPMLVFSTLVAVSGSYVFGSAVGYSSPAQSGIMADLGITVAEYSLFGSILTIGAMIGAIMSGKLADYVGRRGTMSFSEIFCIIGWLAIAFSKVPWWLDLGRLLVGCGMGILSYVVPVYIAEITPKNLRGGFTTVHQLMICCGVSLTFLIGTFVKWRVLALIGTVPSLVQLLGLFFIPESPRWLAKNGRETECEAALRCLRGSGVDIYEEASEIKKLASAMEFFVTTESSARSLVRKLVRVRHSTSSGFGSLDNTWDYTESLQQHSKVSFTDLFNRKYAGALIVGVGLMVLQQFGGVNGISFYARSIFTAAGFSGSVGTIAMVAVQIPMTLLGVILMDISGRRPLLMVSAAGTCFGCFSVALSFLLQDHQLWPASSPIFALVGVLVYTGSFSLGMGAIPWVIMSEIFPINMKGLCGSLVTLVSWLGSWIVTYSFNFLMDWSSSGIFFIFSSICGFTVLFVMKLVPETKRRTLEEIQSALNPLPAKH